MSNETILMVLGGTVRLGTDTDCVLNKWRKNGRINLIKKKSEISAVMQNFTCENTPALGHFRLCLCVCFKTSLMKMSLI